MIETFKNHLPKSFSLQVHENHQTGRKIKRKRTKKQLKS